MPREIESKLIANSFKFAIVAARFNDFIVDGLVKGAVECLKRHGTDDSNISVIKVPGSFEIPLICKKLAETKRFDAVIALGAVIRGATSHYDHVAGQVSSGIAQASLSTGIPVLFGVITCETIEQAIERCGTKAGNKGADAALAAIEMVDLLNKIKEI